MSNIGLNIGLRALLTSQSSLDVIGQNLANANTQMTQQPRPLPFATRKHFAWQPSEKSSGIG